MSRMFPSGRGERDIPQHSCSREGEGVKGIVYKE